MSDGQTDDKDAFERDMEKLFEKIAERVEQLMGDIEDGPTMEHVLKDIERVQKINAFEYLGLVSPSGPCCNWTPSTDIIAIFIHSKEMEERINRRDQEVARLTPGFKTIVFCCYDMHRGEKIMIVQDLDSVMQLQNILGTAVKELKERSGPDPLEKLLS